jgi:hypothetical protein
MRMEENNDGKNISIGFRHTFICICGNTRLGRGSRVREIARDTLN